MTKRKSIESRIDLAVSRGFRPVVFDPSNPHVNVREYNELAPSTKQEHERIWNLYKDYLIHVCGIHAPSLQRHQLPPPTIMLKNFMKYYATTSVGNLQDLPSVNSILSVWRAFVSMYMRATDTVLDSQISKDVSAYIKGSLKDACSLSATMRKKVLTTDYDFAVLLEQLWKYDDHDYLHERYRVQLNFILLLFTATGARAGAIVESNSYRHSNHALMYKHIQLYLTKNSDDQLEFELIVDQEFLKSQRALGKKELKIVLREMPKLQFNAILFFLAIALADGAIKGFSTVDELLNARIPSGRNTWLLRWQDDCLEKPVVRKVTTEGPKAAPLTYSCLWTQLQHLATRTGFTDRLTIHSIRRGVANAIDKTATEAERSQLLGHRTATIYRTSYISNISDVDAQALFFEETARENHSKRFRGMTLGLEPLLPQKLPSMEKSAFETRSDVLAINEQIRELTTQVAGKPSEYPELHEARIKLHSQKRTLHQRALKTYVDNWCKGKYEEEVAETRATDTSLPQVSREGREIFSLIRRFMPTRDRLASSIFAQAPIHSTKGADVLRDLVNLCTTVKKVALSYR